MLWNRENRQNTRRQLTRGVHRHVVGPPAFQDLLNQVGVEVQAHACAKHLQGKVGRRTRVGASTSRSQRLPQQRSAAIAAATTAGAVCPLQHGSCSRSLRLTHEGAVDAVGCVGFEAAQQPRLTDFARVGLRICKAVVWDRQAGRSAGA